MFLPVLQVWSAWLRGKRVAIVNLCIVVGAWGTSTPPRIYCVSSPDPSEACLLTFPRPHILTAHFCTHVGVPWNDPPGRGVCPANPNFPTLPYDPNLRSAGYQKNLFCFCVVRV